MMFAFCPPLPKSRIALDCWRILKSPVSVLLLSLIVLAGVGSFGRANFSISIDEGNDGGVDSFDGPYAEAVFTQVNANTLHVKITALDNGTDFFLFRTVGINVAPGVSFEAGSLTSTAGLGTISPNFAGSDHLNGFGDFNLSVFAGNGASAGLTTMEFNLTGIPIVGDGSNFLALNNQGKYMAMHVNVYGNENYTGGARATGFGAGGSIITSSVPEPASLTLAVLGVLGIAGLGWRQRRKPGPCDGSR
jgi:MYXO-CTERM domain-containing protein